MRVRERQGKDIFIFHFHLQGHLGHLLLDEISGFALIPLYFNELIELYPLIVVQRFVSVRIAGKLWFNRSLFLYLYLCICICICVCLASEKMKENLVSEDSENKLTGWKLQCSFA